MDTRQAREASIYTVQTLRRFLEDVPDDTPIVLNADGLALPVRGVGTELDPEAGWTLTLFGRSKL